MIISDYFNSIFNFAKHDYRANMYFYDYSFHARVAPNRVFAALGFFIFPRILFPAIFSTPFHFSR